LVNAIQPLLELLPPDQREADSPGALLAGVLLESATQLRDRSRNILDYSRAERVNKQPTDVRVLIARSRRTLSAALAGADVRENLQLAELVPCAGPLVEQILVNVIDNAAWAAGPGGWIQISTRRDGGNAVIEVTDSGPGVPVNIQDRIFDPFFTT